MIEPDTRTERTARIVIAVLGVIAAFLGTLTAYFAATKSDVVQQRNDVRSDVSTLITQQSNVKEQVTRLKRENAGLRQQLEAAPADSSPPGDASSDFVMRTLNVPLPGEGDTSVGVYLDEGRVRECGGLPNFCYERQASTGRPQLDPSQRTPFSTAVSSAQVSREECSQAAAGSPAIRPIPPPRSGLLCALSDGGVSLLQIAAPQKDGTLTMSQKYWPKP
jgi:hypothetical protein